MKHNRNYETNFKIELDSNVTGKKILNRGIISVEPFSNCWSADSKIAYTFQDFDFGLCLSLAPLKIRKNDYFHEFFSYFVFSMEWKQVHQHEVYTMVS